MIIRNHLIKTSVNLLFLYLLLPTNLKAESLSLKTGDPAPTFNISTWVLGQSINRFESGKRYVLEFWATWCAPCIQGLSKLNEIQKRHKNLSVICITNEPPETVRAYITENLPLFRHLEISIASDHDYSTHSDYFESVEGKGIPLAFLIDDHGVITWYGHPNNLESQLEKISD